MNDIIVLGYAVAISYVIYFFIRLTYTIFNSARYPKVTYPAKFSFAVINNKRIIGIK